MNEKWPTSSELTEALLKVLSRLGGSANVSELDNAVILDIKLSASLLEIKRSGNRGEIQYRLAWVRTRARQNGLITKEADRIWKLTDKGRDLVEKF
jgi:restriction system protein